jgi:hypothetical protein
LRQEEGGKKGLRPKKVIVLKSGENKPRECVGNEELAAQEKVHQEVDGSAGLSVDKSCGNGRVAE